VLASSGIPTAQITYRLRCSEISDLLLRFVYFAGQNPAMFRQVSHKFGSRVGFVKRERNLLG